MNNGTTLSQNGTILDNDNPGTPEENDGDKPVVNLSAPQPTAVEGETTGLVFQIDRTGETEVDSVVKFTLTLGEVEEADIASVTLSNSDGTTQTYTVAELERIARKRGEKA